MYIRRQISNINVILFGLLVFVGLFVAAPSVKAAVTTGDLLITEMVIRSADDKGENGELYRYIELYNNTDKPIDLSKQKIYYYYEVKDKPWSNSKIDKVDITDRDQNVMGLDGQVKPKMFIQPHSTKIVWIYVPKDESVNKVVSELNTLYDSQLTDDDVVYAFHKGFSYVSQRYIAIVGPGGDKDKDRYSFVRYNGDNRDVKNCSDVEGTNMCDFYKGQSVIYYYPDNGLNPESREMERRDPESFNRRPTPGKLRSGQVPGQPEAVTFRNEVSEPLILQLGIRTAHFKGKEQKLEVAPVLDGNTTMVPFRFIGEALGATVGWDQAKQKVTLALNNKSVILFINNEEADVDGKKISLENAPKIIDGNTMVPLRFVGESLNQYVMYEAATKRITLVPLKKLAPSTGSD
ncbi:stalk domain-containing protein [Paenibacillus foliorum]|uniref:stalk domain-containing protein n=1 Tax=Paenibacillus foliorum TaxID=2654974 RepID=UPI0014929E6C|nr:stalk domain-containing protein [Paenibacillus foliorum]